MSKVIEVEVKSVYGCDKIYPANDAAKVLAELTGKKTFSVTDLRNAGALGLEIVEVKKNYGAIANLIAKEVFA